MGDRASIELKFTIYNADQKAAPAYYPPLYLYSHWGATEMPVTLAKALDRGRGRWSDDSYLARIIASDVFKEAGIDAETGAGLSPFSIEDVLYFIDLEKNTIKVSSYGLSRNYIDDGNEWQSEPILEADATLSFEAFVTAIKAAYSSSFPA